MQMKANQKHLDFRNALVSCIEQHAKEITAIEMLAVAAQFVGHLIAVQDSRLAPQAAMHIVHENITAGNIAAIERLCNTKGTA